MLVKIWDKEILDRLQVLKPEMLTRHGRKIIPTQFYVLGFYDTEHLEEHRAITGYDFSQWKQWLDEGRIYIESNNDIL